ncbi:hypothetical protein HD601_006362 [Jiangella mangrovi]|uniref:Uncharacterized protein n=1 Tax=Jiangella mangrovi TaxID=1524084 RepID=A0A7W9LQ18_9ACTN|nr:hypothetical protein [Jiangella mangrovi]
MNDDDLTPADSAATYGPRAAWNLAMEPVPNLREDDGSGE